MRILITFLVLAFGGMNFAFAQVADDTAEGGNRECTSPNKDCFKNEDQRRATMPAKHQVMKRVDVLSGTATTPNPDKTKEGSSSDTAK